MALVGREIERVEIPHEDGQWVELRALSGAELDEAERRNTRRVLEMVQGVDLGSIPTTGQDPDERERRRAAYEPETLIRHALVGWSYAEPCDDEHKALLDAPTRAWLVEAILERNVRLESGKDGSGRTSSPASSRQSSRRSTA